MDLKTTCKEGKDAAYLALRETQIRNFNFSNLLHQLTKISALTDCTFRSSEQTTLEKIGRTQAEM